MNALAELEKLKPVVQRKLEDINQQQRGYQPQLNLSLVNHPGKQQNLNSYAMTKVTLPL